MSKDFEILVVRLLAAILSETEWTQNRTVKVMEDADKWVVQKQQSQGIVPTLDWVKENNQT